MVETIKHDGSTEPMAIFLMAAISRGGLSTLYAFQQSASLQPGSIKQVIKDLEEAGLLDRSEGTKRGRRTMALTDAGEKFLVEKWTSSLDGKREMESILRSATVALLMGDIGTALNFLFRSASERERRQGPHDLGATSQKSTPIDLHAEMRAVYESRRRTMEADVLKDFAKNLGEVWGKHVVKRNNVPTGS